MVKDFSSCYNKEKKKRVNLWIHVTISRVKSVIHFKHTNMEDQYLVHILTRSCNMEATGPVKFLGDSSVLTCFSGGLAGVCRWY